MLNNSISKSFIAQKSSINTQGMQRCSLRGAMATQTSLPKISEKCGLLKMLSRLITIYRSFALLLKLIDLAVFPICIKVYLIIRKSIAKLSRNKRICNYANVLVFRPELNIFPSLLLLDSHKFKMFEYPQVHGSQENLVYL